MFTSSSYHFVIWSNARRVHGTHTVCFWYEKCDGGFVCSQVVPTIFYIARVINCSRAVLWRPLASPIVSIPNGCAGATLDASMALTQSVFSTTSCEQDIHTAEDPTDRIDQDHLRSSISPQHFQEYIGRPIFLQTHPSGTHTVCFRYDKRNGRWVIVLARFVFSEGDQLLESSPVVTFGLSNCEYTKWMRRSDARRVHGTHSLFSVRQAQRALGDCAGAFCI